MLVFSWSDKKARKCCSAVSSRSDTLVIAQTNRRRQPVSKPPLIIQYNHSMNGWDRMDQSVNYYGTFQRKTQKWWKKLFHSILAIAQVNSNILYSLTRPDSLAKVSLADFKDDLVKQLTKKDADLGAQHQIIQPPAPKKSCPSTNPVVHLTGTEHLIMYVPRDDRCDICSTPQQRKADRLCMLWMP